MALSITISHPPAQALVFLGDHDGAQIAVPEHCWATVDDPSKPFTAALEIRIEEGEQRPRPVVSSITVTARDRRLSVDGNVLRTVPVQRYVKAALLEAAEVVHPGEEENQWWVQRIQEDHRPVFDRRWREEFPRDVRHVGDEQLQLAAEEYRAALADPQQRRRPTARVAERLAVSRATAARWVAAARAAGHLGAALGSKAGEAE